MKRLEAGKGSAAAYSSLDVRTAEMAASNIMAEPTCHAVKGSPVRRRMI
jgi:hypothetical protein